MLLNEARAFAPDLAGAVAQASVGPTLKMRALQDALISAIADRRAYVDLTLDHAGWVVTLMEPDEHQPSL